MKNDLDEDSPLEERDASDRAPYFERFEKPGNSDISGKNYLGVDGFDSPKESRSYLFNDGRSERHDDDRLLGVTYELWGRVLAAARSAVILQLTLALAKGKVGGEPAMVATALSVLIAVLKSTYDTFSLAADVVDHDAANQMDAMRSMLTDPLGFQAYLGGTALGMNQGDAFRLGDFAAAAGSAVRAFDGRVWGPIERFKVFDTYRALGTMGVGSGPPNRQRFRQP